LTWVEGNSSKKEGSISAALLAVTLLRANRIPARAGLGFADDGDGMLVPGEMTTWVEYVSDAQWRIAALPPVGAGAIRYIGFRVIDGAPEKVDEPFRLLYESFGLTAELVTP
jgi:hypothetical protein